MPGRDLHDVLSASATARPAALVGKWLGSDRRHALLAKNPASVLEGGREALAELPVWLAGHVKQYPAGAAIGFFSYELARFFEKLPLAPSPSLPDLSFAYYSHVDLLPTVEDARLATDKSSQAELCSSFDEMSFAAGIEKIRRYIGAGEVYQANLTQQARVRLTGLGPQSIFNRLSRTHAPFAAFLRSPAQTIISNSPERFFRVSNGHILASPIKGTIARGENSAVDRRQAIELLSSPKDRAENVMIVDLLRNDLGRICHYETIRTRLWEIDTLPHLFHLVSHVQGELRREIGVPEILRALFPCGSITGAPKIRAMEILAEIEKEPRGVAMGAIGIIRGTPGSAGYEMDFNVAIRTVTVQNDFAVFNVGCGIVYDSEPRREFGEMLLKARPLFEAFGLSDAVEPLAIEACLQES